METESRTVATEIPHCRPGTRCKPANTTDKPRIVQELMFRASGHRSSHAYTLHPVVWSFEQSPSLGGINSFILKWTSSHLSLPTFQLPRTSNSPSAPLLLPRRPTLNTVIQICNIQDYLFCFVFSGPRTLPRPRTQTKSKKFSGPRTILPLGVGEYLGRVPSLSLHWDKGW